MKPYYEHDGIIIYHGDCREVLPTLDSVDAIITDPVWPNASIPMAGSDDPKALLREALEAYTARARRVVIHLGCDSDPRFLEAVSAYYPFLRVCWLRYARPSYKGRLLMGSDVAYLFGVPPPPGEFTVMPGESKTKGETCHTNSKDGGRQKNGHPCARRLSHLNWLVRCFGGRSVLDPFMGSGTSAAAAKRMGCRYIGIEIEEKYCELAVQRLGLEMLKFEGPRFTGPRKRGGKPPLFA